MAYVDPASEEAQQKAENELDKVTIALTVFVLAVIVERIRKIENQSLADVYASMSGDLAKIEELVAEGSSLLNAKIKELFETMATNNDQWASKFYRAANVEQIQTLDNINLKAIFANGLDDALIDARTKTSALGLVIDERSKEWLPIRDAYVQTIGQAANNMITGVQTGDEAVIAASKHLSQTGLRVKYPNQTRELYSAVRMNVMDTYRRTMVDLRFTMGEEFGADGLEVSAHVPCAPDHQPYQGRQYSLKEFEQVQNNLDIDSGRPLVYGANCHHTTYPILLGVSEPAYSNSQLRKMNDSSNQIVSVRGLSGDKLEMTRYQASQYQRRIEQSIRQERTFAYLSGEEANVKSKLSAYRRISKEAGLPVMMERTKIYAL